MLLSERKGVVEIKKGGGNNRIGRENGGRKGHIKASKHHQLGQLEHRTLHIGSWRPAWTV